MHVAIFGGSGMLGTALCALCHQRAIPFLAPTREEVDICAHNRVRELIRDTDVTHVINCAAYTDVDGAEKEPDVAFAINGHAVGEMAKISCEYRLPLIHISTDYVFKGNKALFKEKDRPSPLNLYGKSKLLGEKLLFENNPQGCVIRTSSLFAADFPNFVTKILSFVQEKKRLEVVDDQYSRPTYAPHLAEAILQMLSYSGLYHYTGKAAINRFQWAQEILAIAKQHAASLVCEEIVPIKTSARRDCAVRPYRTLLSTEKIEKSGIEIKPWQEGVEKCLSAIQSVC